MGKKWLKGLIWGLGGISLLFGLFYCMENNKAVSLTKSDKDKFTKSEKDKLTTARSLGQAGDSQTLGKIRRRLLQREPL
jgi:hypothetical protein